MFNFYVFISILVCSFFVNNYVRNPQKTFMMVVGVLAVYKNVKTNKVHNSPIDPSCFVGFGQGQYGFASGGHKFISCQILLLLAKFL